MQFELVEQGRRLGNAPFALSPVPIVFVLFRPPLPFSPSLPIHRPSAFWRDVTLSKVLVTGVGCPRIIPAHPPHKITSRLHARQAETRDWLRCRRLLQATVSTRAFQIPPSTRSAPFSTRLPILGEQSD